MPVREISQHSLAFVCRYRLDASQLCVRSSSPKLFHGTNSITCANNVLPTFMPSSGSLKPGSIAKPYQPIQIVDTPESSETILNTALTALPKQTNRTLVTSGAKARRILSHLRHD
jgi:hypothetical protein